MTLVALWRMYCNWPRVEAQRIDRGYCGSLRKRWWWFEAKTRSGEKWPDYRFISKKDPAHFLISWMWGDK